MLLYDIAHLDETMSSFDPKLFEPLTHDTSHLSSVNGYRCVLSWNPRNEENETVLIPVWGRTKAQGRQDRLEAAANAASAAGQAWHLTKVP